MAIIFELVVNFGTNSEGAAAATEHVRRTGHIDVRGVPFPFDEPFVRQYLAAVSPSYIEFAVHPRGVRYGARGPRSDLDPRSMREDEIGHALYDLLRSISGYRAAIVGWNPEFLVDLDDLEADWRNGDAIDCNGLVLADDLCERWRLGPEWAAFEPGYRWLPYSGSRKPRIIARR